MGAEGGINRKHGCRRWNQQKTWVQKVESFGACAAYLRSCEPADLALLDLAVLDPDLVVVFQDRFRGFQDTAGRHPDRVRVVPCGLCRFVTCRRDWLALGGQLFVRNLKPQLLMKYGL